MNSFKVGDRVKTRYGVGTIVYFNENAELLVLVKHDDWNNGHNGNAVDDTENLKLKGNHCLWFREKDLELIKSNQKIIITSNGVSVIARLKEGERELKKASAKYNSNYTFDFEVGAKLALERLFDKGVKEVKRLAKVGEYIKIINAYTAGGRYENGSILKVTFVTSGRSVFCKDIDICVDNDEYVVLEGYEPPNEEPRLYNAKVVCVKPTYAFTKGKIYEVKDGFLETDYRIDKTNQFKSLDEINSYDAEFIEVVG